MNTTSVENHSIRQWPLLLTRPDLAELGGELELWRLQQHGKKQSTRNPETLCCFVTFAEIHGRTVVFTLDFIKLIETGSFL